MARISEDAVLYYANHPVEFVQDIIGAEPDDIQAEILRSVNENKMTSVRSGHGTGKSTVESWACIWFMCTRPYPKIPCTAPTQHQLFDILWAEISKWIRNCPSLANDLIWTKEKLYMAGHPEEWFAVARTASKPDSLQGFHADNLLYIIDEASGVDDIVFEPVLGTMSTEGARLLMCGNPTQLSGFFYESHHKNRSSYKTFHIDGRNSPRVSQEFVQTIIDMYGEDSDVFRVRVAGEFPKAENDVFIPLPLVEKGVMNELPKIAKKPLKIVIGVDVARFGDDSTVIVSNVDGHISKPIKRHGQDTMATVGDIVRLYKQLIQSYPMYSRKVYVMVDDTGVGGGVTDRLKEIKIEQKLDKMGVVAVNFGEKIPDEEAADYFGNLPTYMWSLVKDRLKDGSIQLPDDDNLVAELSTRKYKMTSTGKLVLESKDEMKKRGLPSPDNADAVALSCYDRKLFDIRSLI